MRRLLKSSRLSGRRSKPRLEEIDKGPYPRDRLPVGQQQCRYRLRIVIVAVGQERNQLSLRQGGLAEKVSQPQDAYPSQRKVEQQFGTIGCDVPLGGNQDPLAVLEQRPLRQTREAAEQQAICAEGDRPACGAFHAARDSGDWLR